MSEMTIDDVLPSLLNVINYLADEDSHFEENVHNDFEEDEAEEIIDKVNSGNYDIPEDAEHIWIDRCKLADWYEQYMEGKNDS